MTPMIAERRVTVMVDKERPLIFDFNTMAKYEEVNEGKFYWDTMMDIFEANDKVVNRATEQWQKAHPGEDPSGKVQVNNLEIMRVIPMRDLRAVFYAALHEVRQIGGVPRAVWPLKSIDEAGMYMNPTAVLKLLRSIIAGHAANSPNRAELGEASAPSTSTDSPDKVIVLEEKPAVNGGAASTGLAEADFA